MTKNERNEEIRRMYEEGVSQTEIGEKFGLSQQRVYQIINGIQTMKLPEGCGDMSDYDKWDDNACMNLAMTVARVQGREYVRLYRMSKNTHLPKSSHEGILAEMAYLEKFFKKGFLGCIIDGETFINQLKYTVDSLERRK